jgi:hypothetical protein
VADCFKAHPVHRHNASGFEVPPRWQGDKNPHMNQDKKLQ